MLIRASDLEPHALQAVMHGLGASMRGLDPSPELQNFLREDARRFRPDARQIVPWAAGGALVAGALVASAAVPPMVPLVALLAGIGLGLGHMFVDQWRRAQVVHSDLLVRCLSHVEIPKLDRAYCEVIGWLSKPGLRVDEATARSILAELNRLVGHHRKLESQELELASLSDALSNQKASAELARLTAKLAEAQDPMVRSSLEESAALCQQRVENTRENEAALERVRAQRELILQTLASIQASLARLAQADQVLTAADVAAIREQSETIQSHAEAVESAVEEVVALRRP